MEINVGDYVRTENGIIGKLVDEYTFKNRRVCYPEPQEWVLEINNNEVSIMESIDNIIKSSKDIIDLIEVGDYVNGSKVIDIRIDEELEIGVESDNLIYRYIQNKDIKSVLTKEQFEANAYTIEKEV